MTMVVGRMPAIRMRRQKHEPDGCSPHAARSTPLLVGGGGDITSVVLNVQRLGIMQELTPTAATPTPLPIRSSLTSAAQKLREPMLGGISTCEGFKISLSIQGLDADCSGMWRRRVEMSIEPGEMPTRHPAGSHLSNRGGAQDASATQSGRGLSCAAAGLTAPQPWRLCPDSATQFRMSSCCHSTRRWCGRCTVTRSTPRASCGTLTLTPAALDSNACAMSYTGFAAGDALASMPCETWCSSCFGIGVELQ